MKPALTAEEWGRDPSDVFDGYVNMDDGVVDIRFGMLGGIRDKTRERHALAALLLRGQPFGFTREDVALCRRAEHNAESAHDESMELADFEEQKAWGSLADRIEALRPPEGT